MDAHANGSAACEEGPIQADQDPTSLDFGRPQYQAMGSYHMVIDDEMQNDDCKRSSSLECKMEDATHDGRLQDASGDPLPNVKCHLGLGLEEKFDGTNLTSSAESLALQNMKAFITETMQALDYTDLRGMQSFATDIKNVLASANQKISLKLQAVPESAGTDLSVEAAEAYEQVARKIAATRQECRQAKRSPGNLRDRLKKAKSAALIERQDKETALRKLSLELETVKQERDAAMRSYDNVLRERDSAFGERDGAMEGRDAALQERNGAMRAHDAASRERDIAREECNIALRKRDAALQKLATAREELMSRPNINDLEPLANSKKISDATIRGKWMQLIYNIRSLSRFLGKSPPRFRVSASLKDRLQLVSQNYLELLHNDDYRELLLEAVMWLQVRHSVFIGNAGFRVRGGRSKCSLNSFRSRLIAHAIEHVEDAGNIVPWLAQSSRFIERAPDGFADLNRDIRFQMRPFFPRDSEQTCDERVREELNTIFCIALELDEMIRSSKAIILADCSDNRQRQRPQHEYREDVMEATAWEEDLTERSLVHFYISPILLKFGNADGKNYDSFNVLAKAKVVCF